MNDSLHALMRAAWLAVAAAVPAAAFCFAIEWLRGGALGFRAPVYLFAPLGFVGGVGTLAIWILLIFLTSAGVAEGCKANAGGPGNYIERAHSSEWIK